MKAEKVKTGLSKIPIEIFKTNVTDNASAKDIIEELACLIPSAKINFDLDDCDKILRVECTSMYCDTFLIKQLVQRKGFDIQILD